MTKHSEALETWSEKLDHLLKEEATATGVELFVIRKAIDEAKSKIAELSGNSKQQETETQQSTPPVPALESTAGGMEAKGSERSVSVLSFDLLGHAELMRTYGEEEFASVFSKYQELAESCIKRYDGIVWRRGSLCAFSGARRGDQALLTGIHLLAELMVFNLDKERNDLGTPLDIRIAGGDGNLEYRESTERIASLFLDDVMELQRHSRVGELTVMDNLYNIASKTLRARLILRNREYDGRPAYIFEIATQRTARPSNKEIEEFMKDLMQQTFEITTQTSLRPASSAEHVAIVNTARDCYSKFQTFRRWFDEVDTMWANDYLNDLANKVSQLLTLEQFLFEKLNDWFASNPEQASQPEHDLLRRFVGQQHGQEVIKLTELKRKFLRDAGPDPRMEGLLRKVKALINANEYNKMAAFTAVFSHDEKELVELFSQIESISNRDNFFKALWSLADLVHSRHHDDLQRGLSKVDIVKLVSAGGGTRFDVLSQLLITDFIPMMPVIKAQFESAGVQLDDDDEGMIWRTLIVAHSNADIRLEATKNAPLKDLWQTVLYLSTPIESIWQIAQRLKDQNNDDLMKMFFDCVKSRLKSAADEADSPRVLEAISKIIGLFYGFGFFVQNPHFRDLEALLAIFLASSGRFGSQVKLDEGNVRIIEIIRKASASNSPASIPGGIESLTSPVRRHLAKIGCYVERLACEKEYVIAGETKRYIDEERSEAIAAYCFDHGLSINEVLFMELSDQCKERYRKTFKEKWDGSDKQRQRQRQKGRAGAKNSEIRQLLKKRLTPEEYRRYVESQEG